MTRVRSLRRFGAPRLAAVLALVLSLAFSGCGAVSTLFGPGLSFGGKSTINFAEIAAELNDDAPVAVDLVVVYDKKVLETLVALPASEWFATRAQLLKDHPDAFDFWEWQWMPGQSGAQFGYEYHVGAICAIVYADYARAGDHRQIVSPDLELQVRLRANDFEVQTDR